MADIRTGLVHKTIHARFPGIRVPGHRTEITMKTLHAELAHQRTDWLHEVGQAEREHTYLARLTRWQHRRRRAAAAERHAGAVLTAVPQHRPA